MKINFYLPQVYLGVAGGYKVVYQYSNYLASKGHNVCIYYDLNDGINNHKLPKFLAIIIKKILFIGYPRWFSLNKNVKQYAVKHFDNTTIRDADISIATAPVTAYSLDKLSNSKGEKYYFIQGYENWDGTDIDYLHNSYNLGFKNIVISNWLKKIVDKYSTKKSVLLSNGINLSVFKISIPITKRNDYTISMLYREGYNKGCSFGLEALEKIKYEFPQIRVIIVGTGRRPKCIPEWMEYKKRLNEKEMADVYNESAIFMCTSLFEGFALPGLESMACGCALISTKCQGPEEYADNTNSVLCETESSDSLYNAIKMLLNDRNKRINLAKNANKNIKKWDINDRKIQLEKILLKR